MGDMFGAGGMFGGGGGGGQGTVITPTDVPVTQQSMVAGTGYREGALRQTDLSRAAQAAVQYGSKPGSSGPAIAGAVGPKITEFTPFEGGGTSSSTPQETRAEPVRAQVTQLEPIEPEPTEMEKQAAERGYDGLGIFLSYIIGL